MIVENSKPKREHGNWWLASEPLQKLTGVLETDEDGDLRLDLNGVLSDPAKPSRTDGMLVGEHRLQGYLDNGMGVTLDRCFVSNAHAFSTVPRQTWHAHEAIFGAHFDAKEDWAFFEASFEMPGLTRWTQKQSIEHSFEWDEEKRPKRLGITAAVQSWPLWAHGDVEVELSRVINISTRGENRAELESRVDVIAHSLRALRPDELRCVATRPLQVLVGLACGEFTAAVAGRVAVDPRDKEKGSNMLERRWQPLDVDLDVSRLRHAFSYETVASISSDAFTRWMGRATEIEPVLDLYLGALQRIRFAELKFLLIAQALETYHRTVFESKILPREEWRKLKEQVGLAISGATKNATDAEKTLLNKLNHLNEVTLAQRLVALLNHLGSAGIEICGKPIEGFVKDVTATRNYFTHWDSSGKRAVERGGDLMHLTFRLLAMLELLLMKEVGFTIDGSPCDAVLERRVRWLPAAQPLKGSTD